MISAQNAGRHVAVASDQQIIDNAGMFEYRQVLERAPHAKRRNLVGCFACNVLAIQGDCARCHRKNPADHVEHRGLAGSVGADQAENLALEDRKAHIVDRRHATEFLNQIINLQQHRHDSHLLRLL